MIENMQIPVQMYTDALTQPIISPVQETLTAKQKYEVGDLFIFNNGLYKVTTAINQGGPITIGTNCQAAPTLSEELIQRVDENKITFKSISVMAGNGITIMKSIVYLYGKIVVGALRLRATANLSDGNTLVTLGKGSLDDVDLTAFICTPGTVDKTLVGLRIIPDGTLVPVFGSSIPSGKDILVTFAYVTI